MRVFLSHYKAEGRGPVMDIRRLLIEEHQFDTFFDEHDLAVGWRFVAPSTPRPATRTLRCSPC